MEYEFMMDFFGRRLDPEKRTSPFNRSKRLVQVEFLNEVQDLLVEFGRKKHEMQ